MRGFILDPRLEQDSLPLADWSLCRVRLMNDARFPWLILIPALSEAGDVSDLAPDDRARLMDEIAVSSSVLKRLYRPHKINIGMLGNVVSQLHVHIVVRRRDDAAWPGPVWGYGAPRPYAPAALAPLCRRLAAALFDAEQSISP